MTSLHTEDRRRPGPGAELLGWLLTAGVLALLVSACLDAYERQLPALWPLAGVTALFALGQLVTVRRGTGLAHGIVGVLVLGAVVGACRALLATEAAPTFAWTGVSVELLSEALLLWTLAVGVAVLAVAPRGGLARLLVGGAAGLLVVPWLVGFALDRSAAEILAGPEALSWLPWYVQPALLGLVVLGLLALVSLLATTAAGRDGGPLRPGARAVLAGLLALLLLVPGLAAWRWQFPAPEPEPDPVAEPGTPDEPTPRDDPTPPGIPSPTPAPSGAALPEGTIDCSPAIFPERSIDDLRSGYEAATWRTTAVEVLERRIPDASWIVGQLSDPANFDVWFGGQAPASWQAMTTSLAAAVHEDVHLVGFQSLQPGRWSYPIDRETLRTIRVVPGFDRSEIAADLPGEGAWSSYRQTYLEGDSGAQGLETLLDELNAYTWGLLVDVALLDQKQGRTSSRDGLLSMLYFTQLYLARARTEHPDVHRAILETESLRTTIVTLWDRAVCALALSGDDPRLGIGDRELVQVLFGGEDPLEVERLR